MAGREIGSLVHAAFTYTIDGSFNQSTIRQTAPGAPEAEKPALDLGQFCLVA